ncbi:CHAT domain-containing protein [Kitasatospora cinereorecta]|uniref:CHAT domain-containing protein n=1 Tax=Kitasatospora cinereorecta TaxID=285560 RepID=A0ABW0VGM2_9ACTN
MATVVIRVEKPTVPAADNEYLVSLFQDDGKPNWRKSPRVWALSRFEPPEPPPGEDCPPADQSVLLRSDTAKSHLSAVGKRLYKFVMAKEVGPTWHETVARHQGSGALRTYLDIQTPSLREWPWELMSEGEDPVFLGDRHLCLRGDCTLADGEDILVPGRVLIVVGRSDDEHLHADEEVDHIRRALHSHPAEWHVDLLRAPTPKDFYDHFKALRPHIFHFIGHSSETPQDQEPALEFKPTGGDTWYLTAARVTTSFKGAVPRLVLLNACRTSTGHAGPGQLPVRTVAEAFERLGARALLTMQSDIDWQPALGFSETFYKHLADEEAVDLAVRHGRLHLFEEEQSSPKNWARPSLTVHGAPDHVVTITTGQPREQAMKLMADRYSEVAKLADRRQEHRLISGSPECGPPTWRAALVTGAPKVGKSAFVLSCVYTWRLQGRLVAYADLSSHDRRLPWLDVVRAVRDAACTGCPERATGPRQLFDRRLELLGEGKGPQFPPTLLDTSATKGDDWPWQPGTENEPELRAAAVEYLREMLRAVADDQRLITVIDPLGMVLEEDVRTTLTEHLFRPVARDEAGNLGVLLVATTAQAGDLLPADLQDVATAVEVEPLDKTEQLLREFSAVTGHEFTGAWRELLELLLKTGDCNILPGNLRGMLDLPFVQELS